VSAALRRLPPLATTGVGSLPFHRAVEAAHHAVCAYELPFCPQLPRLYGDMIEEWLGADPGGCGWTPDRDRQLPAAWDAFSLALERDPPEHRVVKLQVTGPLTLAVALGSERSRTTLRAEDRRLAFEIAGWLAAAAADQAAALDELGFDTLLIVDEPGLARLALDTAAAGVWDPLRAAAGAWGLHICCAVPWHVVDAAAPDVVSFDLTRYPLSAAGRRALSRLVARGGRVMWGAIDTGVGGDAASAAALVTAATAALADGEGASAVTESALLSPVCGTGRGTVAGERRVAELVRATAEAVRAGARLLEAAPRGARR
jgi:hypothetical protein